MRETRASGQAGFTLLELMMVAGFILTLTALAVSYYVSVKIRANEASAVASLRVIRAAEEWYLLNYDAGYSENLLELGPPLAGAAPSPDSADLIPPDLASGEKGGYLFIYTPVATAPGGGEPIRAVLYSVTAVPIRVGATGINSYYVDESGTIRFSTQGPADASSPPI